MKPSSASVFLLYWALIFLPINEGCFKRTELPEIVAKGAGSFNPARTYREWTIAYSFARRDYVKFLMNYDAVGSAAGIRQFKKQGKDYVHFAGTEATLSDLEMQKHKALLVPVLANTIFLAYNIPGISNLTLGRHELVGIYNGTIRWWNDSAIQKLNNGSQMPERRIIPIARSDGSGNTFVLTSAFCQIDNNWRQKYGNFSDGLDDARNHPRWPNNVVKYYGWSGKGITGLILSFPYSIGYVILEDALDFKLSGAKIINKFGVVTEPNVSSTQEAMKDGTKGKWVRSLIDTNQRSAYPFVTYTYILIRKSNVRDCDIITELVRFFEWAFTTEEALQYAITSGSVPLTKLLREAVVNEVLKMIQCKDQRNWETIEEQKSDEEYEQQNRGPITAVSIASGAAFILLLVCFVIVMQRKMNQLNNIKWKLSVSDVTSNREAATPTKLSLSEAAVTVEQILVLAEYLGKEGKPTTKVMNMIANKTHLRGYQLHSEKDVSIRSFLSSKKKTILKLMAVNHKNIAKFFGVFEGSSLFCVEQIGKKELSAILDETKVNISYKFKFSMMMDIINGLRHLHKMKIIHGNLSPFVCYVGAYWVTSIGGWTSCELNKPRRKGKTKVSDENAESASTNGEINPVWQAYFYRAPESLKLKDDKTQTVKNRNESTDVYSVSIIAYEIFTRDKFVHISGSSTPKNKLQKIKFEGWRPNLQNRGIPDKVASLLTKGWDENQKQRPKLDDIFLKLKNEQAEEKDLIDDVMESLNDVNKKLADKDRQVNDLKDAQVAILKHGIPEDVLNVYLTGDMVPEEVYECVCGLAFSLPTLAELSQTADHKLCCDVLSSLNSSINTALEHFPTLHVVARNGDWVSFVCGLPARAQPETNAKTMVEFGLFLSRTFENKLTSTNTNKRVQYQLGIAMGNGIAVFETDPVPQYTVIGDALNQAYEYSKKSDNGRIVISHAVRKLLIDDKMYLFGQFASKGNDETTYWIAENEGYGYA